MSLRQNHLKMFSRSEEGKLIIFNISVRSTLERFISQRTVQDCSWNVEKLINHSKYLLEPSLPSHEKIMLLKKNIGEQIHHTLCHDNN